MLLCCHTYFKCIVWSYNCLLGKLYTYLCAYLFQKVWSDVELDLIDQSNSLESSYSLVAQMEKEYQSLTQQTKEKGSKSQEQVR